MLTRWNNDPTGALGIHEALLHDTPSGTTEYGRILAEIALDRIQFVSWNRRYDHPWLQQALAEAEEAGGLLTQPYDRLHAHYAQVAVASLSVPRHLDQFQERMRKIKQDLILIPGVKRLQEQLVANDLVKSLSPEAAAIVLPSPSRSPEVLDVAVHANPPKQDILWQWDFDQDEPWRMPTDFVAMGSNEGGCSYVASSRRSGRLTWCQPTGPLASLFITELCAATRRVDKETCRLRGRHAGRGRR